jgi:hypothetical protein
MEHCSQSSRQGSSYTPLHIGCTLSSPSVSLLKSGSPISFSAEPLFLLHTGTSFLYLTCTFSPSFLHFLYFSLITSVSLPLHDSQQRWLSRCQHLYFVLSTIFPVWDVVLFPMRCKYAHFSKFDFGTIVSLVTLSHVTVQLCCPY